MRVLLNDGMEKEGLEVLAREGIEYDTKRRNYEQLLQDISGFDGLIVRSATRVDREIMKAGQPKLRIVGRAGVGYDNIDVAAATELGIIVKNAPNGNTNAAAELALGLMFATSRFIPQAHYKLMGGEWRKKEFMGTELTGKTLGIIGCGRIGQRLAELVSGFSMEILGYDIGFVYNPRIKLVPLEELLSTSDYVSLHLSGKQTVIGERELAMMKPNAILINVARGGNVDEKALYTALKNGVIRGAGLDVYVNEPAEEGGKFYTDLINLPNVVFTSHLGASTREAQVRTGQEIAEVVAGYLLRGDLSNAVNKKVRFIIY